MLLPKLKFFLNLNKSKLEFKNKNMAQLLLTTYNRCTHVFLVLGQRKFIIEKLKNQSR